MALFTQGGDVVGISSKIVQCRDRIETLQAGLVAVKERGITIAKSEAAAEIEEWKADAKALSDEIRTETREYVAALEKAREHNAVIDELHTKLDKKNSYLQAAGVTAGQIKSFVSVTREAKEGLAGPLNRGLSEHHKPLDIHLHDLASNIRVDLPLHMSGQRVGAVQTRK